MKNKNIKTHGARLRSYDIFNQKHGQFIFKHWSMLTFNLTHKGHINISIASQLILGGGISEHATCK